jgi:hypothetical protein
MLSGLRTARRAPSTLTKSWRWSLGCRHLSSRQSGLWRSIRMAPRGMDIQGNEQICPGGSTPRRRHAGPATPSLERWQKLLGRTCLPSFVVITKAELVPCLGLGPELPLEF